MSQDDQTINIDAAQGSNPTSAPGELDETLTNATAESTPTRPHVPGQILVGRHFGRYKIKRELGRGAMGVVYLALDTNLDRQVAVKVPSFAEEDGQDVVDRFYREARAMATISHPNLCPVYDVGDIDGVHYLTMQFVEGRPMSDYLQGGKSQSPKQAAAVLRKLALALEEAHRAGIVHRDLKPANIMISDRNEPVIMDFGLAQRRKKNETTLTQTGQLMGTPAYMSPEQVKGKQDLIGPPTDVYALGVICYQLLTGKLPFVGSLGEVMAAILTEEPVRPSKVGGAKIDRTIEAICLKAMHKSMEERYASAAELAKSLKDYMRGKRLPDEVRLSAPSDSSPAIEPSGSVYTSGQEAQLADDFFADLPPAAKPAPTLSLLGQTSPFGQQFARTNRSGLRQVPKWVWIASGGGVAFLLLLIAVVALTSGNGKDSIDGIAGTFDEIAENTGGDIRTSSTVSLPESDDKSSQQSPPSLAPPIAEAPLNTEQAKQHQEAWAKYLGLEVETTNSIGMKMQLIPPGEFLMGSPDSNARNVMRQCRVMVTKPFLMSSFEVTRGQFRAFVEDTKYTTDAETDWNSDLGLGQTDEHAVLNVSWNDATAFCGWLSQKESITYGLPTEAQWEYACRAGTTTVWNFGDSESKLQEYAWITVNASGTPHPVGQLKPNPWSLCDMHGNAWEWCADRADFHSDGQGPVVDPSGPGQDPYRGIRGGSWSSVAEECRSAFHYGLIVSYRHNNLGFRVAAVPPDK